MKKTLTKVEMERRLANAEALELALQQAVRAAVLEHKRAGNPVADWREGKVVLVPPDEIVLPEEEEAGMSKYSKTR